MHQRTSKRKNTSSQAYTLTHINTTTVEQVCPDLAERSFRSCVMAGVLSPRESGKLIADTSKDIKILQDGVKKCAEHIYERLKERSYSVKNWKEHALHPKTTDKAAVDWIFVVDTLNFCFWSGDESKNFTVNYKGGQYTGYWSLCAAVWRALDKGTQITDPAYYSTITRDELGSIFQSDSECDIPLLDERVQVLQEAGKTLLEKYDGSFVNCIKHCDRRAKDLLDLIVRDFPAYRDEAKYNGKQVSFYKRAQILIADIWSCFEGNDYGEFSDIDTLTMFADYRVPQSLVFFGVLEYSNSLLETLKEDTLMKTGNHLEMEIRGCSIWAIELICNEVKKCLSQNPETKDIQVNSILVDEYLWDYRRKYADEMKVIPFHKIRCIYY